MVFISYFVTDSSRLASVSANQDTPASTALSVAVEASSANIATRDAIVQSTNPVISSLVPVSATAPRDGWVNCATKASWLTYLRIYILTV